MNLSRHIHALQRIYSTDLEYNHIHGQRNHMQYEVRVFHSNLNIYSSNVSQSEWKLLEYSTSSSFKFNLVKE